jgi:hypothetical protein
MAYDIKKSNPFGKEKGRGMEIEIEVGKEPKGGLKFDDEMEGPEDPLAQFEDGDIIMSLQARPVLMEMLKKKLMGESEEEGMEEEGAEVPMEEDESATTPTNIVGIL